MSYRSIGDQQRQFFRDLREQYGSEVVNECKAKVTGMLLAADLFGPGQSQIWSETGEKAECLARLLVNFGQSSGLDMTVTRQDHNVFTRLDQR